MPAKLSDCHIGRLVEASETGDAANVVSLMQLRTFPDHRIEIGSVDADCFKFFQRKIVVLTWIIDRVIG